MPLPRYRVCSAAMGSMIYISCGQVDCKENTCIATHEVSKSTTAGRPVFPACCPPNFQSKSFWALFSLVEIALKHLLPRPYILRRM